MAKTKKCAGCEKARSIESFAADARSSDGLSAMCADCKFSGAADFARIGVSVDEAVVTPAMGMALAAAVAAEPVTAGFDELPTVDLIGVPIVTEGGPYHGTGSPPEGDYFDEEYLQTLADNGNALTEVKAANKIGHSKKQKLLSNSGLDPGEMPAAGWLTNYRVEGDKGAKKLLADVMKVPRKLGALIKSGAFRTRSVEISRVTVQEGDSKGEKLLAITGLAWLGAKAPAIRTLDDIVKLYDSELSAAELLSEDYPVDAELLAAYEDVRIVDYSVVEMADTVAWSADEGFEQIRSAVNAALSAAYPSTAMSEGIPWVRDVAPGKALVTWYAGGEDKAWVVPFSRDADGAVQLAAREDWIPAEQQWVARSMESAEANAEAAPAAPGTPEPRLAILGSMTKISKLSDLSDEQVTSLASTLNLEGDDLRAAVGEALGITDEAPAPVAPVVTPAVEAPAPEGTTTLSNDELAELRSGSRLAHTLSETMRKERREAAIKVAMSEGRLDPADADEWRKDFDENEDATLRHLQKMPVNDELLVVYGDDSEGGGGGDDEKQYRAYAAQTGVPVDSEEKV